MIIIVITTIITIIIIVIMDKTCFQDLTSCDVDACSSVIIVHSVSYWHLQLL